MTLVLIVGTLQGGGSERQLSDMANYWVAGGRHVVLATWSGPQIEDFYPLDSRVRRVYLNIAERRHGLFPRLRSTLAKIWKLRRFLAVSLPDAVLSFVTESNVLTILATVGLKTRVVVSERVHPDHQAELLPSWRFLRKHVYAWSDGIVAQTQDVAGWLERNCGKSVVVIPNALRALPQPSIERLPLILVIGRLANQKGFDVLLRAFARIAPKFRDWRVIIAGEGIERAVLMGLRDELKLTDQVEFIGQTADISIWMARAGLVVQPSRYEGFPNAVLESMGMEAAVISSDCPSGPSELIQDGVNGRMVPVDDVAALARVMAELMSQPQVRERLGREAAKVRQRFNQDRIMAQWQACLFPAISRSQPFPGAQGGEQE
jgi:GalNAc-alpha-(1->4)-GalNAc-alpha-(1->3)-diNAcBac-PP-undecaprenol alpha-1,4-N-acetyl-D-galactosaminyltransferase